MAAPAVSRTMVSRQSRRTPPTPRAGSAVVVPPAFRWAPLRSPAAAGVARGTGRMLTGSAVMRASPVAAALAAATLRCPQGVFGIVAPLALGGLLYMRGVKQFQAKLALGQA